MSATAVCPEPLELRADVSLAQLLTRAHEAVRADGSAECPVCGGVMEWSDHGSSCSGCGSQLS